MEITGCFAHLGKAANTASNCFTEWDWGLIGLNLVLVKPSVQQEKVSLCWGRTSEPRDC